MNNCDDKRRKENEYKRKWRAENHEKEKEYNRKAKAKHLAKLTPEELEAEKEKKRAYAREYYKEYHKRYYQEHKAECNARVKRWCKANSLKLSMRRHAKLEELKKDPEKYEAYLQYHRNYSKKRKEKKDEQSNGISE